MKITANNPNRKSWIKVGKNSDFPIQNIPFGVFLTRDDITTHLRTLNLERHLAGNLVLVLLQDHIDSLANILRDGYLSFLVEEFELFVLLFRNVNGCGYLLT